MMANRPKILMVDDEPKALAGFKRDLRGELDLEVANSGPEALEKVESDGPFAVIVTDYKMPQMNGSEFLAEVRKISPTTVGMLLTAFGDLDTAIEAVHKGRIFRLLTKPCPKEVLLEAIEAGIEQHSLINAEKVLLEKTLTGSVKVLSEVLSLSNPEAFNRALRIRGYVKHMTTRLRLLDVWEFEMAAYLSQLGCVTFPPQLLQKISAGEKLTLEERELYESYPRISANLIANIPRLGSIADMIKALDKPFTRTTVGDDYRFEDRTLLGGYLLHVALEVDRLYIRKIKIEIILARLPERIDPLYPEVLAALDDMQLLKVGEIVKSVQVADVTRAMIFREDVFGMDGMLLVSEGQEATFAIISRMRNYAKGIGVVQPFKVTVEG